MLLNQWMVIQPAYTMHPYKAWGSSKAGDKYLISYSGLWNAFCAFTFLEFHLTDRDMPEQAVEKCGREDITHLAGRDNKRVNDYTDDKE